MVQLSFEQKIVVHDKNGLEMLLNGWLDEEYRIFQHSIYLKKFQNENATKTLNSDVINYK
jgi:hypothetical protein